MQPTDLDGELPIFPTDSFVGRATELRTLRRMLASGNIRLLSITGPPGVGKSRLALELVRTADDWFAGAVVIVRLAPLQDASQIVPELARALGIVDQAEHLRERVEELISRQPVLLLLDNIEHLLDGAQMIVDWLLSQCPDVRMLTTSRRPLGDPRERQQDIHPLPVKSLTTEGEIQDQDAIRLFVDRARLRNPRFRIRVGDAETVARLCGRFDGLPLAIELIASWADVLTPAAMLARSMDLFEQRILVEDPRHQSLIDAIAWSYNLLEERQRALFRRLAIFRGGFSVDLVTKLANGRSPDAGSPWAEGYGIQWPTSKAAVFDAVTSPYETHVFAVGDALPRIAIDPTRALATLIDHRLILPSEDIDGVLCFDMLETIREFGLSMLEREGELQPVQFVHATAMIAFAEATGTYLWDATESGWGRLRADAALPNVRAALDWSSKQGRLAPELIVRLAAPLWIYWQTRGLITEGRRWHEHALDLPPHHDWLKSIELPSLAFLCWIQNDDAMASAVLDEAFASFDRTGYRFTIGVSSLVRALIEFRKPDADLFAMLRHVDDAEKSFAEWEVKPGLGACRLIYGIVARLIGNPEQALELFEAGYSLTAEAGYEWGVASSRYFAAETLRDIAERDPARISEAKAMMHQSLRLYWNQGDFWGAGGAMSGMACLLALQHDLEEAARYFGAADTLMQRVGASLLPTELMTHADTAAEVQSRLGERGYQREWLTGARQPEDSVEAALGAFEPGTGQEGKTRPSAVRLTNRQLAVVRDLAADLDILGVALRRGRSQSATYEMVNRIRDRLNVETWEDIVPTARELGFLPATTLEKSKIQRI